MRGLVATATKKRGSALPPSREDGPGSPVFRLGPADLRVATPSPTLDPTPPTPSLMTPAGTISRMRGVGTPAARPLPKLPPGVDGTAVFAAAAKQLSPPKTAGKREVVDVPTTRGADGLIGLDIIRHFIVGIVPGTQAERDALFQMDDEITHVDGVPLLGRCVTAVLDPHRQTYSFKVSRTEAAKQRAAKARQSYDQAAGASTKLQALIRRRSAAKLAASAAAAKRAEADAQNDTTSEGTISSSEISEMTISTSEIAELGGVCGIEATAEARAAAAAIEAIWRGQVLVLLLLLWPSSMLWWRRPHLCDLLHRRRVGDCARRRVSSGSSTTWPDTSGTRCASLPLARFIHASI